MTGKDSKTVTVSPRRYGLGNGRSTINTNIPIVIRMNGAVTPGKSGLVFAPSLSLQVWEKIGHELKVISDTSAWWLADWLTYGEAAYSGRYRNAVDRTGLDYQTLRNYAWVARRFEISRRHDNLSFAHHAEVAPLEPPEQDYWLRKAEELGWSRNQLRKQVRASLAERRGELSAGAGCGQDCAGDGSGSPATSIQIQLKPEQVERYQRAAVSHGLSLTDWAVRVLESAVGREETLGTPSSLPVVVSRRGRAARPFL